MYDLELDSVVERIKKEKARKVCIQLADGLKPSATEIAAILGITLIIHVALNCAAYVIGVKKVPW